MENRSASSSPGLSGPGVGAHQVRSGHLRGITHFIGRLGGDSRSTLDRCGIPVSAVVDPEQMVSSHAVLDILEDGADRLHDPLFGLRFGATQNVDVFGSVTALGRAAATLGEGLRCFHKYLPIVHSGEGWAEIVHAERHAEWRWNSSGRFTNHRQGNYQSAMLQMMVLRMLGGRDFRPDYVTLNADMPHAHVDEIERLIECPVRRNGAHNAIGFDARMLDWPVPTSNRMIFGLIESHLKTIGVAADSTLIERVHAYIRHGLPTGRCSLRGCAAALGLGNRSLQIRLEMHNMSFSEMVEQERSALARGLLKSNNLSMTEIAGLLGYAEQSSFSRAVRRWYGASPQELRAAAFEAECEGV